MILQHVGALNARQVVLASASPRRSEILSNIGLKFKVRQLSAVCTCRASDRREKNDQWPRLKIGTTGHI